jgi:phenylacetic acid degradation operon negative regulatory protein
MLQVGSIILVASEPRINVSFRRELFRYDDYIGQAGKKEKKFDNAFYYLRKRGFIEAQYRGKQVYYSLTDEGKKKAGKFKLDDLEIKKPKKWDKTWRILIFDIKDKQRAKREALRGKIKELGLYQLQKSVWVCPYEFKKEMSLLRDFFGLDSGEMMIIDASRIEKDETIREFYGLR